MKTIQHTQDQKIVDVKHKQNVSFLGARQIEESYIKDPSYAKKVTTNTRQPD